MLDLSAAFDTVDHNILLTRFRVSHGIRDAGLDWLQSYLKGRMECVRHGTNRSMPTTVWYGVSQRLVLGAPKMREWKMQEWKYRHEAVGKGRG